MGGAGGVVFCRRDIGDVVLPLLDAETCRALREADLQCQGQVDRWVVTTARQRMEIDSSGLDMPRWEREQALFAAVEEAGGRGVCSTPPLRVKHMVFRADLRRAIRDPFCVAHCRNRHLVRLVVQHRPQIFHQVFASYPHGAMRRDRGVVLAAVKNCGIALRFADEALKKDRTIVMAAVQHNGDALEHAHPSLRADRDVVLAAVSQNGLAIQYADETQRFRPEIVTAALSRLPEALCQLVESAGGDRWLASRAGWEAVRFAVGKDGTAIQWANEQQKDDKSLVLSAIRRATHPIFTIAYASERLRCDPEIVEESVWYEGVGALSYVGAALRASSDFGAILFATLWLDGLALRFGGVWVNDAEMATAAVRQNGLALQYVGLQHVALQYVEGDVLAKRIALAAVENDGMALRYVGRTLLSDERVVLTAVRQNGDALKYVDPPHRNRKIVLEAVRQRGEALQYADELAGDFEVAMEAVRQTGAALEYVRMGALSRRAPGKEREIVMQAVARGGTLLHALLFRADRGVVQAALWRDGLELQFAARELRSDPGLVLEAARAGNVEALHACEDHLLWRADFVLQIVRLSDAVDWVPCVLGIVSERSNLTDDKTFILEVIKCSRGIGYDLQHAGAGPRDDEEVVLAAVQRGRGDALRHASPRLRSKREVVVAAVRQWGGSLAFASSELRADAAVVREAVKRHGLALQYAHENVRIKDAVTCALAVQQDGEALRYVGADIKYRDSELVLKAVRQCKRSLRFASTRMQQDPMILQASRRTVFRPLTRHRRRALATTGPLSEGR